MLMSDISTSRRGQTTWTIIWSAASCTCFAHPDLASGHVPQIGAGQAIEEPGRGLAGQGGVGAAEVLMKTFWAGIHSDFQIWGLLSSPWGWCYLSDGPTEILSPINLLVQNQVGIAIKYITYCANSSGTNFNKVLYCYTVQNQVGQCIWIKSETFDKTLKQKLLTDHLKLQTTS